MSERDRLLGSMGGNSSTNNAEEQPLFERVVRPVVAEFVGTTLFVFVGCCALVSGDIVAAAVGHGLTIALLIMGLGEIRWVSRAKSLGGSVQICISNVSVGKRNLPQECDILGN